MSTIHIPVSNRQVQPAADENPGGTIRRFKLREPLFTAGIVLLLVFVSTKVMLRLASPEWIWDEAHYAESTRLPWRALWSTSDYHRHGHGPLLFYVTKLGRSIPPQWGSVEDRWRFPLALIGSMSLGLIYWGIRHVFGGSRSSALVGSVLLGFSLIRVEETHIIGPHHVMLVWILCICILGYKWRSAQAWLPAVGLGLIFGFAAITMSYWTALLVCWLAAVIAVGGTWIQFDRNHLRISWQTAVVAGTMLVVAVAIWPPAIPHLLLDFVSYVRLAKSGFPTYVGGAILEPAPRSSYLYWLAHLDAPILLLGSLTSCVLLSRLFRKDSFRPKRVYLASFLVVLLGAALSAHIAGGRNLLFFTAVLCLTVGVMFDDLIAPRRWMREFAALVIVVLSAGNLAALRLDRNRIPNQSNAGYDAFVRENKERLEEKVVAIVDGRPILKDYAERAGTPISWKVSNMPWTTRSDVELPRDAKYALISELSYRYLPTDQPVRRIIDRSWKVVWSFKTRGSWGLRLYEHL